MTERELQRARPLLDLIAHHESESAAADQGVASGYDVVVWQAFHVLPPERPLSCMSVAEVLAWQQRAIRAYRVQRKSRKGYGAAGRYQFVRDTLQGLVDADVVALSETFDADAQDRLALALLHRRGYGPWQRRNLRDAEFADRLAKEWASLPYKTGRSFYDKDGHGNRALVGREEVMAVLKAIKESD